MDSVLLIVALGAVAAGFVQGLSGFGFGMVAMSFWAWTHPVKTPAHGGRCHQLAGERAAHGQQRGQAGLQRPGPERHGYHAKTKARQALHKPGGHCAQGF